MMKSPILLTAITIAIVIAKVFYFRYELFNDLSLIGLLSESILWLSALFFNSPIVQKKSYTFYDCDQSVKLNSYAYDYLV